MLFNSPEFIFAFLPVALAVFFALGALRLYRPALSWLVLASLFFYGWWEIRYLALILSSVVFNYWCGNLLSSPRRQKFRGHLLVLGVSANLALIGYFKYANFFLSTLDTMGLGGGTVSVVLPIGISFFTFQQIAYLVDAARGETEEHNFLNYSLFVTFFPQLIAGPIVHHRDVLPQFSRDRTFHPSYVNLTVGATIFIIGLFKKVVIADNLALVASPVFAAAEQGNSLHFFQAWQGAFGFTFQLYFDFSGYSDMAIGLARMFGIRLPENFQSPYKATSIIDFWRRWHMTLSRFLRDYLYYPLGGNRKGRTRRYLNLMVTMLLGGLWHGAGWTFVLWGGLHGLFLIVNHAWQKIWRRPIGTWWSILLSRATTLVAVLFTWVFFRAESFQGAVNVLKGMVNLPHTLETRLGALSPVLRGVGVSFEGPWVTEADTRSVLWLVVLLVTVWALPNSQEIMYKYRPVLRERARVLRPPLLAVAGRLAPLSSWRPNRYWGLYIGLLAALSLLSLQHVSEFLYFQF